GLRPGGMIEHLEFTPDGNTLVSFGKWDGLRLWDPATGKESRRFHDQQLAQSVSLSPDGKWLAVLTRTPDGRGAPTLIRDFASGRLVRRFGNQETGSDILFSPDGKGLAAFRWGKTRQLWDPATGGLLPTRAGHQDIVWDVAFSRDGKTLVSSGDDKTVRFWDVATGREVRQLARAQGVWKIALSPDGKVLASIEVTKREAPG